MDMSSLFLFFMQPMQGNPTLVLPSQQRLHKLGFLQKLVCQKPYWDFSSLVNKQVGEMNASLPHLVIPSSCALEVTWPIHPNPCVMALFQTLLGTLLGTGLGLAIL